MPQPITINNEDILQQVRLSGQIPTIVDGLLTRKVITLAANEANITVESEELQKAADQFRLLNKLFSPSETYRWMEKYNMSVSNLEDVAYINVISGKLAQHLFADKVEPWFYEHQLDYANVCMYEVVLDNEELAIELFYAIQEGEVSFSEVARQYIQDNELRRSGGYRGMLNRKDLKPEISAIVFATKPPQLLKPIVTSKGVHLIFVEEFSQPQLDKQLRARIIVDLFSEWTKQQVEELEVVINADSDKQTM